jgi:hypothetical protein
LGCGQVYQHPEVGKMAGMHIDASSPLAGSGSLPERPAVVDQVKSHLVGTAPQGKPVDKARDGWRAKACRQMFDQACCDWFEQIHIDA